MKNEISNRALKENLANTALNVLQQGKDYDAMANTVVEFGYLFETSGNCIEALFKINTDRGVHYFAVQRDRLLRLRFTEELFKTTVEGFLELNGEGGEA